MREKEKEKEKEKEREREEGKRKEKKLTQLFPLEKKIKKRTGRSPHLSPALHRRRRRAHGQGDEPGRPHQARDGRRRGRLPRVGARRRRGARAAAQAVVRQPQPPAEGDDEGQLAPHADRPQRRHDRREHRRRAPLHAVWSVCRGVSRRERRPRQGRRRLLLPVCARPRGPLRRRPGVHVGGAGGAGRKRRLLVGHGGRARAGRGDAGDARGQPLRAARLLLRRVCFVLLLLLLLLHFFFRFCSFRFSPSIDCASRAAPAALRFSPCY